MKRFLIIALLTSLICTGCGSPVDSQNNNEVTTVVTEDTVTTTVSESEELTTTESTTMTTEKPFSKEDAMCKPVDDSDTEDSTESFTLSKDEILPITENETANVIDTVLNGVKALGDCDAENIVKYTNIDMMWYLSHGTDAENIVDETRTAFEKQPDFAKYYDCEFEIISVQKTDLMLDRIKEYTAEFETSEPGAADIFEHYNISETYVVNVNTKYDDHEGDSGFVVVFRENGELKFDMYFSYMMEILGMWQ